jgi:hypothetical protein
MRVRRVQFKAQLIDAVIEVERKPLEPLPEGWVELEDPNTGRAYYYSADQQRTMWCVRRVCCCCSALV